ncbi:2-polyprenylphenol 6-hydroxylase [Temperatibacter marinus]|uniref:2-polyprenylphenol 6-hydroxylase n=1 Tax=Temperatibacter marinus TaxID=1456591 RepID=A0AA52EE61_9PROT|nr:2-polyprenylphenol 6-hydroxylase [Temperatibacter marinus]WND03797.1 2-polyprenylphenol 6-hydroxylase [Temperatibacter marinus]
MFKTIWHIGGLYRLALNLRRHHAIETLNAMPVMPALLPSLLRATTFFIPRKRRLPENSGARLALALSKMGPAYIKLGQTLATRPDVIGRPLAEGLLTLQDRLPAFEWKAAKSIMESELGTVYTDHFSAFDETPIAAASIAQVHKATTLDGQSVAVKIRRPDIIRRFQKDLSLFSWIAALAENHSAKARRLRLTDVVKTVEDTTLNEMDFRKEAASCAELAANMEGEHGYRIPSIDFDLTFEKMMTIEWVDGIRLIDRDQLVEAGHDLNELSQRIVQIFLKQAMRDGYFHADLHQGNLIVEADGTIAAIDFGIMGHITKKEQQFLAEILYGFILRDYERVAEVHFEAGYVPRSENVHEFAQALKAIADPIMDLPVSEISAGKLLAQLFATTERFSMQTQPQLILLQRTMVMAEGMALHLNPEANMWEISRPILEAWMRDNLSPEIILADFITALPKLIRKLPASLERLLDLLETMDQTQAPNTDMPQKGNPITAWVSFTLGLIAGAALLKIFFL